MVSQPGTIDYVQQYQSTVLGEHPINWGDVIVVVMILGLLFGGGAFVYWNERRRRGLKGFFSRKAIPTIGRCSIPVVEGYSSEVTELSAAHRQAEPGGIARSQAHPGKSRSSQRDATCPVAPRPRAGQAGAGSG